MNEAEIIVDLKPEKVKEILAKNGQQVTLEEAADLLDFLKKLASIASTQTNKNENCRSVYPREHG